jgi:hypothetical protein
MHLSLFDDFSKEKDAHHNQLPLETQAIKLPNGG